MMNASFEYSLIEECTALCHRSKPKPYLCEKGNTWSFPF